MDASAGGDWVSREYLRSTFALRMKQLADDPTIPLFFGRLDYADGVGDFHIGRRHVSDEHGDPMVIDWRAPVSLPFYRATRTDPMGVELRRRFGFQHGSLTSFEDEDLTAGAGAAYSAILEQEIERPRVGPMRDIVATIQPEQDVIVRSDLSQSICVQGAPGTGKTAVGLHRAAYLLFAHREQLTRQGVLVVGPNASFLRYIRDVLPALGEVEATQSTIAELAARALREVNPKWSIRGEEPADVATLKGDARLAEVLVAGALVARDAADRGARRAARCSAVAGRDVRGRGGGRLAARARGAVRRRARDGAPGAGPPGPGADGARRRLPRRPRAERRRPQQAGQGLRGLGLAGRRPGSAGVAAAVGPRVPRGRRRGAAVRGGAGAPAVGEAAEEPRLDAVDPRRGDPRRRGRRPRRAHGLGRAHRGRRGAGPLADDAARPGPAVLDRLADRARRPRAGHHPVGHPLLGRGARPPGQARRPRRAADPRVPGAGRGDRVRRPAAARDRARPRATDVGPSRARRAGDRAAHVGRRPGVRRCSGARARSG